MVLCSVMTALTFFFMPAQTTLYSGEMTEIVDLPAGYFVLQSGLDAPSGYISVVYDDITGYVKSEDVEAVDYTPVTKYEKTVIFTCDNDGQPVNLRAAPKKSAEIITTMPSAQSGHSYGTIAGEALIGGAGTTWYYVAVGDQKGYVYYAHVSVIPTPPNIIEKEEGPEPEVPTDAPATVSSEQNMSATAAIIFIVALCIPVPFIMYFLFKKPKE